MKHKHQCVKCRCVWSHSMFAVGDPKLKRAHTCPSCGHFDKIPDFYTGTHLPHYVDHHTNKAKIPFASSTWCGTNRQEIWTHLFTEHRLRGEQMAALNHEQLAEWHERIHETGG